MTKKDYELIAGSIKQALAGRDPSIAEYALIRAVSIALSIDNSKFDEVRFLKACRS